MMITLISLSRSFIYVAQEKELRREGGNMHGYLNLFGKDISPVVTSTIIKKYSPEWQSITILHSFATRAVLLLQGRIWQMAKRHPCTTLFLSLWSRSFQLQSCDRQNGWYISLPFPTFADSQSVLLRCMVL